MKNSAMHYIDFNEKTLDTLSDETLLDLYDQPFDYHPLHAQMWLWKSALFLSWATNIIGMENSNNITLSDITHAEIGLSKNEIRSICKQLTEADVLIPVRNGKFKSYTVNINTIELQTRLHSSAKLSSELDYLATSYLSIQKIYINAFVWLGGNARAAIMLSALEEITKPLDIAYRQNYSEWLLVNQSDFETRTGLSTYDQASARKWLMKMGIIEQKREGMPAQTFCRISYQKLGDLTARFVQQKYA